MKSRILICWRQSLWTFISHPLKSYEAKAKRQHMDIMQKAHMRVKWKTFTFLRLGADFQFGWPGYLRLGFIHDLERGQERGLTLAYHKYEYLKILCVHRKNQTKQHIGSGILIGTIISFSIITHIEIPLTCLLVSEVAYITLCAVVHVMFIDLLLWFVIELWTALQFIFCVSKHAFYSQERIWINVLAVGGYAIKSRTHIEIWKKKDFVVEPGEVNGGLSESSSNMSGDISLYDVSRRCFVSAQHPNPLTTHHHRQKKKEKTF